MESNCRCGRTFVAKSGSALCPICIAEVITGKGIKEVSEDEYQVALIIFREMPLVTMELHSALNSERREIPLWIYEISKCLLNHK